MTVNIYEIEFGDRNGLLVVSVSRLGMPGILFSCDLLVLLSCLCSEEL